MLSHHNYAKHLWAAATLLFFSAPGFAQSTWKAHDMTRPRPVVITPAPEDRPHAAPSDAIVLFDGNDLSHWVATSGGEPGWEVVDGEMRVKPGAGGIRTKQGFGDVQLHIEWSAPAPEQYTSQNRGNSGVIFMGKYEVQVLDSYENETYADGQAAALYGQYPPLVNAMRPNGSWQTYDIIFRRPRFNTAGGVVAPVRITVLHNGVVVQDSNELWGQTTWLQAMAYESHPDKLPLFLQDHGTAVRFRNIWIRELAEESAPGPSQPYDDQAIEMSPEELDHYVGSYGASEVKREGSRMLVSIYGNHELEIIPRSRSEFVLKHTDAYIVFDVDSNDRPTGFTFHIGGATHTMKRSN